MADAANTFPRMALRCTMNSGNRPPLPGREPAITQQAWPLVARRAGGGEVTV
jgi:hypothetical protein